MKEQLKENKFYPHELGASITLCGRKFILYSLEGFEFDKDIYIESIDDSDKGVYYFSKRKFDGNKYSHKRLYLGKTDNLSERPLNHKHDKWKALKKDECNCLGIYKCSKDEIPKDVESEILAQKQFKENVQEN